MALLYDRVLRHRQIRVNKSDTTWNWSSNTPCKSLKGILVLFEEEEPYKQNTSKFYNPKIQKVSVIVECKPNQLFAQGMQPFEHYQEICKYFTEGKQKDNNANEIQKPLQLQDVKVADYLTDKYALGWISGQLMRTHYTGQVDGLKMRAKASPYKLKRKEKQMVNLMPTFI